MINMKTLYIYLRLAEVAAAAIAFAIVGVYTLRKGEILGGCLFVFVGCPVWILAALLFKSAFNKE